MWKFKIPDPDDERFKGMKFWVDPQRNRIWIEIGPDFPRHEPRPGRPIPPEDLPGGRRGE